MRTANLILILIALAVVNSVCADASAQGPNALGTLSSSETKYEWIPALSDTGITGKLTGRHDELGIRTLDRDALARVFSSAGLTVGDRTIPSTQLYLAFETITSDHAKIFFSTPDTLGLPSEIVWVTDSSLQQPAGEFWPGDVVVFNGTLTINGEVGGNVLVIGGDAIVREAATVRGGVVVIGGILRQRGDGKIYGKVFAPGGHRRPRLSVIRAWEFENEGVQWGPAFSYDRVDGLRFGGNLAYQKSAYAPRLALYAGYGFASETWQYRFRIEQQLFRSIDIELHGSVFRLTETEDEAWVGRHANTVYSLSAGSDYRDYYGADGGELGVTYKYRERGVLSATYRNTDYRWMDAERNLWHVFRPNHPFRENFSTVAPEMREPLIDRFEERTSALLLGIGVEPRESDEHPTRFDGAVRARAEIAGGALGGEFDYDRWQLSAMGEWNGEDVHRITARFWYGNGRRDLPPNKFFYLGGIGTLPGYPQKAFVGRQALLASMEYRFVYWANQAYNGGIILFFDLGRATFDDDFLDLSEFKSDVGVGFGFGEGIRLDVAKGLDRTDRDIRVSLNLKGKW